MSPKLMHSREGSKESWLDDIAAIAAIATEPAKPERQPLTDEEIARAWAQTKGDILQRLKPFARAIEAAHGIKEKIE